MKALYKSEIYHKRFSPRVNEFTYSGFYIRFSLDEIQKLKSKLFGINRFNLFSFYESDHGYRDGTSLKKWAQNLLSMAGLSDFNGEIELQTFPRVLGFVFNPVSFWYCFKDNNLEAVICEVNNTFGESHNYVITKDVKLETSYLDKEFHVSPFYDVKGKYQFDFRRKNEVKINYYSDEKLQLITSIKGNEIEFSEKNLFYLFLKFPLFTRVVVFLIHFEALKLFLKKCKYYPKPIKKIKGVTYE